MTTGGFQMPQRRPEIRRRQEGPRKVRHGIKISWTAGEPAPRQWIAAQWMAWVRSWVSPELFEAALAYARSGQTVSVEITAGKIAAQVQGRMSRPYGMAMSLPTLSASQWSALIRAMAGEVMYAAKLLSNELPPGVQELVAASEAALMPDPALVQVQCNCREAKPCKHAVTAALLVADRLEDDPLLIFTLRGLPGTMLIERLRDARSAINAGGSPMSGRSLAGDALPGAPPLEERLDSFWRPGSELDMVEQLPPPHHAPHALLRRLGPSPLGGKFPLVGLLASIYDEVSQQALRTRDAAERIDDSTSL